MFSLRVAIIFALSTQFVSYATCGYVVVPFPAENSIPESETPSETKEDPLPETLYTPVIETTTVPTLDEPPEVEGATYAIVQPNLTVSDRLPRQAVGSSLWKDCTNGKGCFIKHFRQYNYYYPNGQKVMVPTQNPRPITAADLLPNNGNPVEFSPSTSSISMTNNNGRVSFQTNSRPTVRYNLPGVASYVPNNGFNYIYNQFDSGLRQGAQSYAGASTSASAYGERSASEEEQVLSEESSAEPNQDDDNVNKDITTYASGPNMFDQSRTRVMQNGYNGNFQSQQVSVSSSVQSQPYQVAEEEQEEIGTTSESTQDNDDSSSSSSGNVNKDITTYFSGPNFFGRNRKIIVKNSKNPNFRSQTVSSSTRVQSKPFPAEEKEKEVSSTSSTTKPQPLPNLDPALNLLNYYGQNRLMYGYDPYFQTYQQFGIPPLPPLPVPGFTNPIYNPSTISYLNPVNSWVNYPTPSTLYDIPGMAPAYSVIL